MNLDYILTHKKIKNIYIRIDRLGQVCVTAPMRATKAQVEALVSSKQEWINQAQHRQKNRIKSLQETSPVDKVQAKKYLTNRLNQLSNQSGLNYNRLTLRTQKTRWGSCSSQKNISLNYNLIKLSPELMDYVILHELAHTKYMNHSKIFWEFLEGICPGAKKFNQQLKRVLPNS